MLKEKLQEIIDASAIKLTDEAKAIAGSATQAVADSIAGRSIPQVGDAFPEFVLPDSQGIVHRSTDLVGQGQLILTFFRGGW